MIQVNRISKKYQNLILSGIILLAILLRFKLAGTALLPGVNGGYYPLMIKSFLSSNSFPFKDAPLVFWLESLVSKILFIFMNNHDSAIFLSGRIVDAFIPPLAAIPIFSLAMRRTKNTSFSLIASAFLILFFPVSYLLTGDMHKNAMAIVWFSAFLASIEYLREKAHFKNLILPALFLMLMALTHFGTLAISLLAIPLIISPLYKIISRKSNLNILIFVLFLGARADRLTGIIVNPFNLFEHPVLWYLIDGQKILNPFLLGFSFCIQLLSIFVLINSIRTRKGIYWAVLAVLLSSPFIGIEWYLRLAIMAHIPLIMAIICQWNPSEKLVSQSINTVLLILTLTSVFLSFTGKKRISLTQEELSDLYKIEALGKVQKNDIIICSHGTEWWSAWILNCHVAQEQAINTADFKKYSRVLTLSRGENSKSIARGQINFGDPFSGQDAKVIFEGQSIVLRQVSKTGFPFVDQEENLVSIGQLSQKKEGGWQVKNPLYTNPLIFDNIQPVDSLIKRIPNTKYRIYGRRQAFSLNIIVSQIEAISDVARGT